MNIVEFISNTSHRSARHAIIMSMVHRANGTDGLIEFSRKYECDGEQGDRSLCGKNLPIHCIVKGLIDL